MKSRTVHEFGDFQTPLKTAEAVAAVLKKRGLTPRTIIEPTCGIGSFLEAANAVFPDADHLMGFEINPEHAKSASERVPHAQIQVDNFFERDWIQTISKHSEPTLIIGNPPWVTTSDLGALGALNVPEKSNFKRHRGLDAKTGKSNFDLAEFILTRLIEAASDRQVCIAMLIKTAVARKTLSYIWSNQLPASALDMHSIDAQKIFGASVPACLFICSFGGSSRTRVCNVHASLNQSVSGRIGWDKGRLIANADAHLATQHLELNRPFPSPLRWRSGVKHDCSKIMELNPVGDRFTNGLGEEVDLEKDYAYPMLKGSDVANERSPRRWMIVPQRTTGEETDTIKHIAPKTWQYLLTHGDRLDSRASSIYKNRPRFSIFGVGEYTFRPWKIAICGLYKKLRFHIVGPHQDKPVVFDDTIYTLSFNTQTEAIHTADLLHSDLAQQFFASKIFWDNKRPITAELLNQLDLKKLEIELGLESTLPSSDQHTLFDHISPIA